MVPVAQHDRSDCLTPLTVFSHGDQIAAIEQEDTWQASLMHEQLARPVLSAAEVLPAGHPRH